MPPYDQAAYAAETAYTPKHLLASGHYTTKKLTLLSGENVIAGTLLGLVLAASAATVTPGTPVSGSGGTVGNGAVGTWTVDDGAMEGTWLLEVTVASSNAGKFKVVRPDGTIDGVGTVAVAYNGQLNGTLADGANDWVVGDVIPIVVSYDHSVLKARKAVAANTDGSQYPDCIALQDCDATSADAELIVYETGNFVEDALTLGAGTTIAAYRERLRAKGITIDA